MYRLTSLYADLLCVRSYHSCDQSVCCVLSGILLLEQYIMLDDGDMETKTAKRARTERPQPSSTVSRWIELARSL